MCKSYERERERERERDAMYDGILKTLIGEVWEVNKWIPCTVGDIFQNKICKLYYDRLSGNLFSH